MANLSSIPENLSVLNARVSKAAGTCAVRLMAVSKGVEAALIEEALKAGQRLFGENYVQEAASKWVGLKAQHPDAMLHLIGHLQSNKAAEAVALFDAIDSLDRPKLADVLAHEMRRQGKRPPLLIEVNIGREPQKYGCPPPDLPELLHLCYELHLPVRGLMAIPPLGQPPEPFFNELAALAAHYHLPEISMGMSSDFESAIACGSTLVRVGTALFGERKN